MKNTNHSLGEKLKEKLVAKYLEKDSTNYQPKSTDVNILLNRVKFEKKNEFKKNLIITAGAIGTLAVTGLITFI